MESNQTIARQLREGKFDRQLCQLYGAEGAALQPCQERLCSLLARYQETYHQPCASLFSVSGRTELSGNHTDHQNGCVLAAGVSLDVIAAAAPNGTDLIRVKSAERRGGGMVVQNADGQVALETEDGVYTLAKEWGHDPRCMPLPPFSFTIAITISILYFKDSLYKL